MAEKKEIKKINLLDSALWSAKNFKINKIQAPDFSNEDIQNLRNVLIKAAEKSYEKEKLLLKKINSTYSFSSTNFESNISQKDSSWETAFSYLKENGDDLSYWISILKTVSSPAFIGSLVGKAQKIYSETFTSKKEGAKLGAASLFPKQIVQALRDIDEKTEISFDEKSQLLKFSPSKKGTKGRTEEGDADRAEKIINDAVGAYKTAIETAISIMGMDKDKEKILKSVSEHIRGVYERVYQTMWRRAVIRFKAGGSKEEDVEKWLKSMEKSFAPEKFEVAAGSYSYRVELYAEGDWVLELSGGDIELSKIKRDESSSGSEKSSFNSSLKKNALLDDDDSFIKKLMEIMLSSIVSHMGSAQSKKDQPEITNPTLRKKMISLMRQNFQEYKKNFESKNGIGGRDKSNNNVYAAYIKSSFGSEGVDNRQSLVQGTFGEILFAALLALKIDGLTKDDYEEKVKDKETEYPIATYINGQQLNQADQQAHDDIVVIIDNKKIGIQVKQYNSKNIRTEGHSFYGEDYNFFGKQAFEKKGFARYLTTRGENNNDYIVKMIKTLRSISLSATSLADIDVTSLLYPHFLRFARVQDDLESGLQEAEDLTYNNFYVFNFALIPTSQIISQIIVNIDNDLKTNEQKSAKGIFKIKPIKVPENVVDFSITDDLDLLYRMNKDAKWSIAEGQLNFVGLSVKPSRWYSFDKF